MAKKNQVSIKIEAEPKKALSGLQKVTEGVNKLAKSMKTTEVGNFGSAITGLGVAFKGMTSAIDTAKQAVVNYCKAAKEVADIYDVQLKAETQLENAAKNNPYLSEQSVKSLKLYASEIQNYTTYGDEQLLPFMAQLASAGRTQDEIMKIMSAAVDVAASGSMSLDSAVKNLNKTFSGTAGELGKINPAVGALTKEELQNGKAVDLLAESYKGMAKDVREAQGAWESLANDKGDFQEQLGRFVKPTTDGWAKLWDFVFTKGTSVLTSLNDRIEHLGDDRVAKESLKNISKMFDGLSGASLNVNLADFMRTEVTDEQKENLLRYLQSQIDHGKKLSEVERATYDIIQNQIEVRKAATEEAARLRKITDDKKKAEEEALEAQRKANQEVSEYKQKAIDSLKKQIETLELKAKIEGTEVEVQDKLNAYTNAYISLIANSNGRITENNSLSKEWMGTIQELTQTVLGQKNALAEAEGELSSFYDALNHSVSNVLPSKGGDFSDELKEMYSGLEEQYARLEENELISNEKRLKLKEDFAEKTKEINAQIYRAEKDEQAIQLYADISYAEVRLNSDEYTKEQKIEILEEITEAIQQSIQDNVIAVKEGEEEIDRLYKEHADARRLTIQEQSQQYFSNVQNGLSKITSMLNSESGAFSALSKLKQQAEDAEMEYQMAKLEKQYKDGLITEEEYLKKKDELEKEAQEKQYKRDLASWAGQIIKATASVAEGCAKALASAPFPGNIAAVASTALAGAAQIAMIVANKPIPPSFSTGGFLTGNSTSGDKIPFMGNAYEAILNPAEQRTFMDMANGKYSGGGVMPSVVVYNNNAKDNDVSTDITEDKIGIIIDKRVKEALSNGKYNTELNMANNSMSGTTYAT